MKKTLLFPAALLPLFSAHGASIAYRNAVLGKNPVAYYEFDETSGTTAIDSSGNGHDGIYTGSLGLGVTSGGANLGTAVDFTGGHVTIPTLGTFSQSTFETWIQLDVVNSGCCTGILTSTGWDNGRVHINVTNGSFEHAVNSDSTEVVRATPAPLVGEWYHLVITNDVIADETIFYLNGVAVADDGDHGSNDTFFGPGMQIGAWDGTRQLDGRLDEVAIYDSVLSPTDVANNFAAATIPEPSGAILLFLGSILATARRRR